MATKRKVRRITKKEKSNEPSWEGWEDMDGQKYHRFRDTTHSWYYQTFKPDELSTHTYEWMENNDYSKEEIKCVKAVPSYVIGTTTHITCRMLTNGMPDFNQKEDDYWQSLAGTMGNIKPATEWVKTQIAKGIEQGKVLVEQKKKEDAKKSIFYQPTIQQRLYQAAIKMTQEIDDVIEADDSVINLTTFKPLKWLQNHQCKGNHAKIIKGFYQPGYDELHELLNPPSRKQRQEMTEQELDWRAQLDESFECFTKEEIQTRYGAYKLIVDACDMLIADAKVNRKSRKRKPKSAEKLVTKLKYKLQDEKTTLVSINPVDIIKSEMLWVYNTKTRKLGKYVASNLDPLHQKRDGTGLSVKGTTITGFKEDESLQKTLRKPVEQIAEFKKCGKIQRKKFFESLKITETKLNGRINPETILLLTS